MSFMWRSHDSCHIYEGFMSHMSKSYITRMNESYHTYEWVRRAVEILQACSEWVMSHIVEWVVSYVWMSHITIMKEQCHAYEWFVSYICMSHVKHINGSCHTYKWVMSHTWMGHACHAWVMSHIWMSHVTRMDGNIKKSCHAYKWVILHIRSQQSKASFFTSWEILWRLRNESCHTCELSHVTYMCELCHTCETSHVTYMSKTCRERERERENKHGREDATPDSYAACIRLVLSGIFVTNIYWSKETPPPGGVFLFTMFPDQEPCVRDFTTRCDGRISSWNLLHTALDQGT